MWLIFECTRDDNLLKEPNFKNACMKHLIDYNYD